MSPTRRELVCATRARIVDAAARLTRERGPNGFSMDALAEEASVARATVYEHFRSKRAVLDELASSMSNMIRFEQQRNPAAEPLLALRDLIGVVCRHWAEAEERIPELRTLNALTGTRQANDGIDVTQLRPFVEALETAHHLRSYWSVEEATDALAVLTSYSTYERLRAGPRAPEQVECVMAKLAVAIVRPSSVPSTNES